MARCRQFQDCINFISRKCRITVFNASVDQQSRAIKGYVKTQNEAKDLITWSGVKFAGNSLRITKGAQAAVSGSGAGGAGGNTTIETITEFLKSRYNPEIKLLNLSSVKLDPQLLAKGFFATVLTSLKLFPALMKIAADLKLQVDSVDLSMNELTDLTSISSLPQTFPYLQNLALLNNNFTKVKSFELWKHKLNFLRELVLLNNPLINQAQALQMSGTNNLQDINVIKTEVMKNFPRLIVFNGEIVRDEAKLKSFLTFPFDQPQLMFFQDEMIQQVSTNFVTNFYNFWDGNRQDLMVLYQQESQFSVQVDSSHPHTLDASSSVSTGSGYNNRNTPESPFSYYLSQSRNLTRVSNVKSRLSKVATGQQDIFKLFQQFPKTRHDLLNQPQLFSMESYSYPQLNGIMLTLHGSFEEIAAPEDLSATQNNTNNNNNKSRYGKNNNNNNNNKKIPLTKKSFDRTFIILPGPNGSMIVASDLLTIRLFAEPDAWNDTRISSNQTQLQPQLQPPVQTPGPAAITPTMPGVNGGVDLPMDVKANLNDLQQQILLRILMETKLNLQYSIMLCEQSQWDYQQCINNFKQSVNSLPPAAYQ